MKTLIIIALSLFFAMPASSQLNVQINPQHRDEHHVYRHRHRPRPRVRVVVPIEPHRDEHRNQGERHHDDRH
jgi:hypothetical protein